MLLTEDSLKEIKCHLHHHTEGTIVNHIVGCTAIAMQRPRDRQIYKVVSGQRLSKQVPAATDTSATIEELCFLCGPCRDVISTGQSEKKVWFCTGGCEERTWAREAEESPLLEAVARERLVKTLTHSLTHSWSWALLEKLPIVQIFKNFPAFYGTQKFITMFTRALHWSWARSIQSIPSHPISW
jgi:hypothetical protein